MAPGSSEARCDHDWEAFLHALGAATEVPRAQITEDEDGSSVTIEPVASTGPLTAALEQHSRTVDTVLRRRQAQRRFRLRKKVSIGIHSTSADFALPRKLVRRPLFLRDRLSC